MVAAQRIGRHQIGNIAVKENVPAAAPKISLACTRLSQHEMTIASGLWPFSSSAKCAACSAKPVARQFLYCAKSVSGNGFAMLIIVSIYRPKPI